MQAQRRAVQNLGRVDALDSNFSNAAGTVLEALVPEEGDKGKLQVNVNVPVSATTDVGFEFVTEAERNDNGIKMRVQVGGTVTANADLWIVEAFARANVFGYMEAQGDSGPEVFDLMLLGIWHRIQQVSEPLADALFSRERIDAILSNMDRSGDDYVESGLGLVATAGIEADGGPSAEAGLGIQTGTRLTRGEDTSSFFGGESPSLQERRVSQVSVALSFTPDGEHSYAGKLTVKWEQGRWKLVEAEVSGDVMIPIEHLTSGHLLSQMIATTGANLANVCSANSSIAGNRGDAARVSSLARFIAQNSTVGVGVEAGTQALLQDARNFNGVSVGHKLTMKATYDRANGMGLEVTLDRVSTIEFGDNPRAPVYVLLENIQNVFTLKT